MSTTQVPADARLVPQHQRSIYELAQDILQESRRNPGRFQGLPEMSIVRQLAQDDFSVVHGLSDLILAVPGFFVSAEMTMLAKHAAKTFGRQTVLRTDLPSPNGFIVFSESIDEVETYEGNVVPHHAVLWTTLPELTGGCYFFIFTYDESGGPFNWSLTGSSQWVWGEPPRQQACEPIGRALLTTWTLMQQKIAANEVQHASRAERRRWERMGQPAPTVTVTQLRKTESTAAHESGERLSVDWSHRWLVGGHWRNQWLPGVKAHRQQWIAPYVKGPLDRPLVIHQKVQAFVK